MTLWHLAASVYVVAMLVLAVYWWHHDLYDENENSPIPLLGAVFVCLMFGWVAPFMFLFVGIPEHFEDKAWESGKTNERREREAERLERRVRRYELKIRRVRVRQAELRSGKRHICP